MISKFFLQDTTEKASTRPLTVFTQLTTRHTQCTRLCFLSILIRCQFRSIKMVFLSALMNNQPVATRIMGSGIQTANWRRLIMIFQALSNTRFRILKSRAKNLESTAISQTIMEGMDLQPSTVRMLILVTTPTAVTFQRRTPLTATSICHHNTSPNINK